jgi:hypothetical protein
MPGIPGHPTSASLMRTDSGVRATFSARWSYRVAQIRHAPIHQVKKGYPVALPILTKSDSGYPVVATL